jgi:nucleoside-diphosphate-sugar epimerase
MARILITGGAGYVGRHCAKASLQLAMKGSYSTASYSAIANSSAGES